MTTSWSRWTFALGMAAAVTMATGAVQAAENEPAGDAAKSRADAEVATPTHRQTQLIKVNDGERSATQLNSFATTPDGRILAGCGSSNENGEVRVFDAEGNYVETWSSPVRVEAIGVRAADGVVFIAGNGRLVKLDPEGAVLANEPSPHATLSKDAAEKIREQVLQRAKQMATTYERQITVYDLSLIHI